MKSLMDLLGKSGDDAPSLSRSGDNLAPEKALSDDTAQAGFDAAAQDAFHALKTNDESGFSAALQTAIEMSK